jgi:flagellar basal body rod protein FlgF
MRDTCTTERVGMACALLYSGGSWPTRQLAYRLGITTSGAYAMLARLSRVLPVALDNDGWRVVQSRD